MTKSTISIAGSNVVDPVRVLRRYAEAAGTGKTVRVYDLGDRGDPNVLTADEVWTTRQIHSRMTHQECGALVQASTKQRNLWLAVPANCRLVDADPAVHGGLYDHMDALFQSMTALNGIGNAKASKVLHLKRPHLYPMLDTRVVALYRVLAAEVAKEFPERGYSWMYWAAVRKDIVSNEASLKEIRERLVHLDGPASRLVEVSDVRLLDILSWSRG